MSELTFRLATVNDGPLIQSWWNNGNIMTSVGFPNGLEVTLEKVQQTISSYASAKDSYFYLILKEDQIAIGEFTYSRRNEASWTVGIKIGEESHQGKGYGQEALKKGISLIFNSSQEGEIVIEVDSLNLPALNLYLKNGFKKIAFHENSWFNQLNEACSSVVLALTYEEWYMNNQGK